MMFEDIIFNQNTRIKPFHFCTKSLVSNHHIFHVFLTFAFTNVAHCRFNDVVGILLKKEVPYTLKKIGLLRNLCPGEEPLGFRSGFLNLKKFNRSKSNPF